MEPAVVTVRTAASAFAAATDGMDGGMTPRPGGTPTGHCVRATT